LTQLQEDVAQIHSSQTRQENVTILDWLTPVDHGLQQSENINTREQGTGHWLIETEEFQTWLSTQGQTLFCRGIPGVGKTIPTSTVVDHLISNFRHNSTIGIAYIYCNFRRVNDQTTQNLFASLLKQLAASLPDLPVEVKSLYTKHQQGRTRPSSQEILSALNSVAARFSRVFVVIDALDETGNAREDFLIELRRLQQQNHINLFSTSRHDMRITNDNEELFKDLTKLEIIAAPEDLHTVVRGNLKCLPSSIRNTTTLPQDIVGGIAESVDGMQDLTRVKTQYNA
jgi:Cdc6-like AAA superfamily ATPase